MSNIEKSLVLIKPDGMAKDLTGCVLNKFSSARLSIIGIKLTKVSPELAKEHYRELSDKPFFNDLVDYIQGKFHGTKGVIAIAFEGQDAIKTIRAICGATNPEEADPLSIRGSYGRITSKGVFENVVHASSSPQDGVREIGLWFKPEELLG